MAHLIPTALRLAALAIAGALAVAQQDPQAELKQKRTEKLANEVFTKAKWSFDFDAVRAESKRTGKPIFTYFTRSYTRCGPCEALEGGALSDPEFAKFAASVVLFVHNTSRVDDEKYPNLLREKGFTNFPSLCFMDADGNVLVKQGERSVAAFETTLQRLRKVAELREKAKDGGAEAQKALFFAELEMQSLTAADIKKRMDQLALTAEEQKRADPYLVDAELRDLRGRSRELGPTGVGDAIAAIAKAGRQPTSTPESAGMFWQATLAWCSKNGEPELAQKSFDELKKMKLPAAMEKRLEALVEAAKAVAAKSVGEKEQGKDKK